jgi:hypothetical protein
MLKTHGNSKLRNLPAELRRQLNPICIGPRRDASLAVSSDDTGKLVPKYACPQWVLLTVDGPRWHFGHARVEVPVRRNACLTDCETGF